jgi:hypothetical protein
VFSPLAFFSFVELTDPSQHRAYNEWHQLDHRPENLALPGVAWGDRWARPDDYKAVGTASEEYARVDYTAMYWLREPIQESVDAWDKLGSDSFQWGRGPMMPGVERRMLSFYRPVKGYAAPRVLVSPDVLPFRPNRGLHVTLTRAAEPHSPETHALHQREDRELIPALLDVPGVAGAWTFAFSHPQRHATLPLRGGDDAGPGSSRIRLLYLDDDPLETTPLIEEAAAPWLPSAAAGHEVLLSSPVRTIIPWQDW